MVGDAWARRGEAFSSASPRASLPHSCVRSRGEPRGALSAAAVSWGTSTNKPTGSGVSAGGEGGAGYRRGFSCLRLPGRGPASPTVCALSGPHVVPSQPCEHPHCPPLDQWNSGSRAAHLGPASSRPKEAQLGPTRLTAVWKSDSCRGARKHTAERRGGQRPCRWAARGSLASSGGEPGVPDS